MFADDFWVEDVELVGLHNLGQVVVHIIVIFVILVPLETDMNTVEETSCLHTTSTCQQLGGISNLN